MNNLVPIQILNPDSPLINLLKNGRKQKLLKKQSIQFSDDKMTVCLIESGFIKRYLITNDGNESIQAIYGAGEIFPLTHIFKALFDQDIYYGNEDIFYSTITDCEILYINKETLLTAVNRDSMIFKDLLQVAGLRLFSNIERLENKSLKSANKQVADLLYYLAIRFGKKLPEGIKIEMPITHELLGSILNLSRETVTIAINQLENLGFIAKGGGIVILQLDQLEYYSH